MMREFHITIVSPSDVAKERLITKEVCNELNYYLKPHKIKIVPHLWEDYPGVYHLDRQSSFNLYHDLSTSDLFVAILWRRIGTILTKEYKGLATNKARVTGTQYELESAIALNKSLWIYIKKDKKLIDLDSATYDDLEQNKRLKEYIHELKLRFGNAKHSYNDFYEENFKELFRNHLIAEIKRVFGVKIDKEELPSNLETQSETVDPAYYAGLYVSLAIGAIIYWLYTMNFITSPSTRILSFLFVWSLLFVNIPAVKSLPTYKIHSRAGFRQIVSALTRRASFMLFFAVLLTIVLYLVGILLGLIKSDIIF